MRRQETKLTNILWWLLFVQLLVLVAGFGAWSWLDYADAERQATEEVENSGLVLEEYVFRSMSAMDGALLQTADLVNEIGPNNLHLESAWRRLQSIARSLPRSGAIFVYDLNGDTLAASSSHPAPVFNASAREYFQRSIAFASDYYIGRALRGQTIHKFFFPIARAINANDGRVLAVAQIGVEVDYIADLFTKAQLRGKAFGLYGLSDGTVVARHPMTENLLDECIAALPFFSAISGGTPHWTGWVNEKSGLQLATARRVGELPLLLTASMPYEDVFGQARNQLIWRGVGLLVAVGALVTLGAMLLKGASREEQIQNALREANERYELVLGGAQSGIWDWDVPRRKVVFSPVWKAMRGFGEQEIGEGEEEWSRRIHPEDGPRVMAAVQAHFEGKTPAFCEEYRVQRKDGSWMWIVDRGIAKRDVLGNVVRMAGSENDITERKLGEQMLVETRAKLEQALNSIANGYFALDAEWRFIEANPVAERHFGESAADLIGRNIWQLTGTAADSEIYQQFQKAFATRQPHHFEASSKIRPGYWAEMHIYPREDKMEVYFTDISARKQAEGALRASEAKYRSLFENMTEEVHFWHVVRDAAGRIKTWRLVDVNPPALKSWGRRSVDEIRAKTTDEIFGPGATEHYMPVVKKIMTEGAPYSFEDYFPNLDKHFRFTSVPLGDYFVTTGADITDIKKAHEVLRQAKEQLEDRVKERTHELARTVEVLQAEIEQRMRAENKLKLANEQLEERADQLRRLAAQLTTTEQAERKRVSRILHDGLQQHLASAQMQLGDLAGRIDKEDLKRTAEEIERIIDESLSMSRSLSAELSPPILQEAGLSEALKWLSRWMREKHRFSVDLSLEAVPELREDVKVLVFESVRELLFNACKHAQTPRAKVRVERAGDGELRVTVSDEGAGFDSARILPGGDGGGFGLFSIRERIGMMGGRFEIASAPGRGSRLALIVPHGRADAASRPADGACTPVDLPSKDAGEEQQMAIRVLLVDDHALFRNGIARLLKNEPGLEVVGQAADGKEAIEFAQTLKPEVILMDISMPGINGIEATRAIHQQYPEIRIIGLSMHEDPERAQAMIDAGAADYKTKGCAAAELVSAIRGHQDARESS